MTLQAHFKKAGEIMVVRIINDVVLFIDIQNNTMSPFEGLSLNKLGVIREYPDLKDNPNWKQIAIERFVSKIKSLKDEKERMDFMIKEMKEMQYTPMFMSKNGFRPQKIQ